MTGKGLKLTHQKFKRKRHYSKTNLKIKMITRKKMISKRKILKKIIKRIINFHIRMIRKLKRIHPNLI